MASDDYNAAARVLGDVGDAVTHLDDDQLLALGHEALGIILLRTKSGRDADGNPFKSYSPEYARTRSEHGLGTSTVDLARTGHMLQAATVQQIGGEVAIVFMSEHEARKAAAHNFGVDKHISVRAHSRSTYVNKKGQRVTSKEARLDKNRKNKRVYQRAEQVNAHSRHMRLPKREFFDIRLESEWTALAESAGVKLQGNLEKVWRAK